MLSFKNLFKVRKKIERNKQEMFERKHYKRATQFHYKVRKASKS